MKIINQEKRHGHVLTYKIQEGKSKELPSKSDLTGEGLGWRWESFKFNFASKNNFIPLRIGFKWREISFLSKIPFYNKMDLSGF